MTGRTIIFSLLMLHFCFAAEAAVQYPFLGEIMREGVNVRAGQNINFEKLCTLKKGEEVVVADKSYQWYKVKLPLKAECYISKKYVKMLNQNVGVVIASNVNLRAGAGVQFTSLGQLVKDNIVTIKNDTGDWYKIEPVEGAYGWIAEDYLAFKSAQLPASQPVLTLSQWKNLNSSAASGQNDDIIPAPVKKKEPALLTFVGTLEPIESMNLPADIHYKLLIDDKNICYLAISPALIERFSRYKVKISGLLKGEYKTLYPYPVISVSKIHLVL